MKGKVNILIIFILVFQTLANSLAFPSQAEAKESIFTDMTLTNESGEPVQNENDIEAGSVINVHMNWSIAGLEIKEGYSESQALPDNLHIQTEQQGSLMAGETEIGTYKATTDGQLTATFHSMGEEKPDAEGTIKVKAVSPEKEETQEEETGKNEKEPDNAGLEETESDPDASRDNAEGAENNKEASLDNNESVTPEVEENLEKDNAESAENIESSPQSIEEGGSGVAGSEGDLENIFTFDSFQLNGNEITDGDIIDIEDGTEVKVQFEWDTEGLEVKEDDTASMPLPDVFQQGNFPKQEITTEGVTVGTYTIENGELQFVFNENIEDGDVQNGTVGFQLEFDVEKFQENIEQEIDFNDSSDKTLTVIARPSGEVSGISKEGNPDREQDATEITWTVDVMNDGEESITEATLEDTLPDGLGEPREFVVQELSVGLDGSKNPGGNVDVSPDKVGNSFSIAFNDLDPYKGYRVKYTTTIDDYGKESFTNDATFSYSDKELTADSTVSELERSNPIEKNGEYNKDTGQIDWTIMVNKSGVEINEAKVEDTLPDGLTLEKGSIEVDKQDSDGNSIEDSNSYSNAFPIDLGEVTADEIYQIKFSTDINWSQVNGGEYQLTNEFTNQTELNDGDSKFGEDEHTVEMERDPLIEKSGSSNVDYNTKTLTWTIDVNEANHPIRGDAVVTDSIPEGLSILEDIDVTGEDGKSLTPENIEIDETEVTINLGEIGTEHVQITYTTEIDDFNIDSFDNAASLEGGGIGEASDEETINPPSNTFRKEFNGINYEEKTMDWSLDADPTREALNSLIIKDTFPNKGMILLPDTVEVTVDGGELTEGEDYSLDPRKEDSDEGYHKGFIIELTSDVLPLNGKLSVDYQTSYDPEKEVEGNTLDPHVDGDGEDRVYRNHAQFTGITENGNNFDPDKKAKETLIEDSWNSGKKEGQLVREDAEGNQVNGWESGSDRKVAWELYTNYQEQNLGTGVEISDTLQYDGTIDEDSIQVSVYNVSKDGSTNITDETLPSENYSVDFDQEDNDFVLTFDDSFEVDKRYVVEFTTSVPDISQPDYTNKATVTVGEEDYGYSGTVSYEKHDNFLEKGPVGLEGNDVFTGEEIDWEVNVNDSLSIIEKAVITDTISDGLVYVEDSLEITTADDTALTANDDYTLVPSETDNGETKLTIELVEPLEETLTLNYQTVVTEEDGPVNNTVDLDGKVVKNQTIESESLSASQFSWVDGEYNPNRGAIQVTKKDAEEEETIANNEATFELSYELNGDRFQFGETFTTENGVLNIGNLPLRTYYLEEVESPEGYELSDEEIEINVEEPSGSEEEPNIYEVNVKNTKEKIDVTGTKEWQGGENQRPESIELQLYRGDVKAGDPVTLQDGETEYTWENLDRTDINGNEYDYRVNEVDIPENYEKSVSDDGLTVTNEFVSPTMDIAVEKAWEDNDNQDGDRPESIEVALFANGEETDTENITLSNDNKWQGSFTDLPEFDNSGSEITYTVEEVNVPERYESVITGDDAAGFVITNKWSTGSVELTKVDENNSDKKLQGAVFDLQDQEGNVVEPDLMTDVEGTLEVSDLEPGSYQFVETSAPDGYKLNDSPHTFTIQKNQQSPAAVTVENAEEPSSSGGGSSSPQDDEGSVKLTKAAAEDTDLALEGAVFTLEEADGDIVEADLTTNEDGEITVTDLDPGEYQFVETEAPEGYILDDSPVDVEIQNDEETTVTVTNEPVNEQTEGSVLLTKINSSEQPSTLQGAVFNLENDAGEVVQEGLTTNEDGEISVTGLEPGDYQFVETEAPNGYEQSDAPLDFTIVEDQQEAVTLTAENEAQPGTVQLTKTAADDSSTVLENAVFTLEQQDGTVVEEGLTTGADGTVTVSNLEPGDYQFIETQAPEGYEQNSDPAAFTMEAGSTGLVEVTVENEKTQQDETIPPEEAEGSVALTKVDATNEDELLEGAVFTLQTGEGTVVKAGLTTNSSGKIFVNNLEPGTYEFVETEAPEGYELNENPISFEIQSEQPEAVNVTAENAPADRSSSDDGGNEGSTPSNPEDEEVSTPSSPEGIQENGDQDEEGKNKGQTLPDTSTTMFNVGLTGVLAVLAGLFIRRRRKV